MVSAETDLSRGQHWEQGQQPKGKGTFGKRRRKHVKEKIHLPPGFKKQELVEREKKYNYQLSWRNLANSF